MAQKTTIGPTVEQMEEYLGPSTNIPRHWSRAMQRDVIEPVYYQRKADEVLNRHKGVYWARVFRELYASYQDRLLAVLEKKAQDRIRI